MFRLLKQLFLFVYLSFVRKSKRKLTLDTLMPGYRKRQLDIPCIPAALEDFNLTLPNEWQDYIDFVGIDSNGMCCRINTERRHDGNTALQINLDIPGSGQFFYKEFVPVLSECDSTTDHIGGRRASIHCLDPMKRWKVCFRGPLQHVNVNGKRLHATILLYWQCLFDPYDHFLFPSCWKLAADLSRLSWTAILRVTSMILDNAISYEQWGELRGRVNIEGHPEINVKLKCVRKRHYKNQKAASFDVIVQQHFLVKETGLAFSQHIVKLNDESAYFGYTTFPIGDSHPTHLHHAQTINNDELLSNILAFPQVIKGAGMEYTTCENMTRNCFSSTNDTDVDFTFKRLTINDRPGFGIQKLRLVTKECDFTDSFAGRGKTVDSGRDNTSNDQNLDILPLNDAHCTSRSLVGGKACQLAIANESGNCNVPRGLCLTTNAFLKHKNEHKKLNHASNDIKNCLSETGIDALKHKCNIAAKVFRDTPLDARLRSRITQNLEEVFGSNWDAVTYAVRSSSVNEDNSQTSAAGHLETYLCVKGLEDIISAVQNCWASSFSYHVVEYRRQNGQELLENTAVIIQEMVHSEVSGVTFTVDPVNGDGTKLVINATYGLGVSVVSGEVETDTIVVDRTDEDNLVVDSYQSGDKETQILAHEVSGVRKIMNSQLQRTNKCMQDKHIFLVCDYAVKLENMFLTPLDIEWAISNETLYILQVRPVTSLVMETDEDLIHEFDSPVVSERQLLTSSNAEEVMPGAVSTLADDLLISAADRSLSYANISRLGLRTPVHSLNLLLTFSGLPFLNVTQYSARSISSIGGDKAKDEAEIQLIGQVVNDHSLQVVKDFIGRDISTWKRLRSVIREFITLKKRDSRLFETLKRQTESFSIGKHDETAATLYNSIQDEHLFYFEMWRAYLFKSNESAMPAGILMQILKRDTNELNTENLADIALIFSDCGEVVSAQIPYAIRDLAKQIANSNFKDKFLNMPTQECDAFLKNFAGDELKSAYAHFMEKFGHRGIREMEFFDKCWSQDPGSLIETIKLIIQQEGFGLKQKKEYTVNEIIDGLQTKLSFLQKIFLKWYLISKAMKGVANRELGKSYVVKVISIFKIAFWRLAELMVCESRLPEPALLFFLTNREIGQLLDKRSAKLIRLAKRRKKLFPERNKIVFPKINIGVPQPISDAKGNHQRPPVFTIHGMPVCRGKAVGRACVIKSVKEAGQLREGDVLICRYTDVGWSPYFPLISGLVTEVGGLISHGAVIARECGIPCIVSTPSATDLLQSGDHVVLDATAGIISKV